MHWNPYGSDVNIDVLHVPDCPSLEDARARLGAAMREAGVTATVREIKVVTSEAAAAAGMHGSPTILIDGSDPFVSGPPDASLSCRLYRSADGVDGAPSVVELIEVLSR